MIVYLENIKDYKKATRISELNKLTRYKSTYKTQLYFYILAMNN